MRLAPAGIAALAALVITAPAQALVVGISDQQAGAFGDARLRALGFAGARLIVPWNAATSEPATVQAWLDAARAAGLTPHVAFEHLRSDHCPSSPCALPSVAEYSAAVRAFHARFPSVTTFTTWNEANHETQPTASRPETVAGYYDALRSACASCTVVAGDVIDSGSYTQWLRRLAAASSTSPSLWGLHNYTDVTYGTTSGTDGALDAVGGTFWIEETGGIVVRRDSAGREILRSDESRAAAAISQAFTIAASRPRIARMYIYQWQARTRDTFDAGLVRPDGALRPSYTRLAAELSSLRTAQAAATTPTATKVAVPRFTVAWSRSRGRTVVLRTTCAKACTGKVSVTLRTLARGTRRLKSQWIGTRAYRRNRVLTIRISATAMARVRRATRRSLALTVTPTGSNKRRSVLTLKRP